MSVSWWTVIALFAIGSLFAGVGLWQFVSPQVGMFRKHGVVDKELGDRSDAAELGERLLAYVLGLILVFCGLFFLLLGVAGIEVKIFN